MEKLEEVTATEAGFSRSDIYLVVFKEMINNPNGLTTQNIYQIINDILIKNGKILSKQGQASIRFFINKSAVEDGFVYPHQDGDQYWKITPEGKKLISEEKDQTELVFNEETQKEEYTISNTVKGTLFEKYVLGLLKIIYPYYSWFHQGVQKNNERGLDLIAQKIGEVRNEANILGVQVKCHQQNTTPTQIEWLKFLAGCFARHIDKAIFVTTGHLSSEQRREAGEAKITVIEGIDELNRIAKEYNYQLHEE
jgi:hypothetical protein